MSTRAFEVVLYDPSRGALNQLTSRIFDNYPDISIDGGALYVSRVGELVAAFGPGFWVRCSPIEETK